MAGGTCHLAGTIESSKKVGKIQIIESDSKDQEASVINTCISLYKMHSSKQKQVCHHSSNSEF